VIATIAKLALTATVLLVVVRPAHAQNVAAEALFREGKELLNQGKLAEACAKFDASDRLEPSVGTELNAADCHEKNNKLATAWAGFLKAAGTASKMPNEKARETEARRRAALLQPKLSYLTISVPQTSRVNGLAFKMNGADVDSVVWNTAVPVDAGEYEITGEAKGYESWSTKLTIAVSEKKSVVVPPFKELPKGPTVQTPEKQPEPVDQEPAPVEVPRRTSSKVVPVTLGVGSVALLGAGLTFELLGRSSYDDAKAEMMDQARRDSLERSANTKHKVAQGLAIGGVACAGAAVVMYLLGRSHDDEPDASAVRVVPSPSGLAVLGRF
jgi:hypothetical protein